MTTVVEFVTQYIGTSVDSAQRIADRLPKEVDYLTTSHRMRDGGSRKIVKPHIALDMATKNMSRKFAANLSYVPPDHVHGFVRGRSTVTNARRHLAKSCVLRVDLKEFFPSISSVRVDGALQAKGFDSEAAGLCTALTTVGGSLPIGFSTSPYLSNLVFEATDRRLALFAVERELAFTRYVDDLIFSGEVRNEDLDGIKSILEADDWTVNDSKTKFMRKGGPQYVTGLYVGCADGPKIPRAVKRRLRWIAHMISVVGYDEYMGRFGGEAEGMLPQHLLGWARHLCSVEPDIGYPLLRFFIEAIPERYVAADERFGDIDFWI